MAKNKPANQQGQNNGSAEDTGAAKKVATKKVKGLVVTTKRDGFRRGGREWHGTTEVPLDSFNEKQVEQIMNESMLVVQEAQIEVAAE